MQQQPQMIPMVPTSFSPTNITTEQIQKYLDENKKLIMAILDNQNLGKLAECAQYQAQLQKNLMYLAAIADAQPHAPTMPPQMAPHPAMQQGAYFMQHSQAAAAAAAAMAQQSGIFPHKVPLQFNNPHQMQDPQQQQQQQQSHQQHQHLFQGQMGMRAGGGANIGMHPIPMHGETTHAGGPSDVRGGSKQDASESGGATGGDGQANSAAGHGSGDGESYLKGSEEGK